MINSDKMAEIKNSVKECLESNDVQALTDKLYEMAQSSADEACSKKMAEAVEELDAKVLAQRGHRALTSEERQYYTKLAEAMRAPDARQAITNLHDVLPETVIEEVFEDLVKEHPLLAAIDFKATKGITKFVIDSTTADEATWGELCGTVSKELTAALTVLSVDAFKLTAFIYVCKAGQELGPEWLDAYVRDVLKNALAGGLEKAIVTGTGNNQPIGMDRNLESESNGTYAQKSATAIADFKPATLGAIVKAITNNGARKAEGLIMVVNPADYYDKIYPAMTTLVDGVWKEMMPFGIKVIQSAYVAQGRAILGLAKKYFACVAIGKEGRIEYSDDYRFLEDQRTYLIRAYGNGRPVDNTAFKYLNIANVAPVVPTVNAHVTNTTSDPVNTKAVTA